MPSWDELLEHLAETPRENGTAALQQTAHFLADAFARAGVDVELVAFDAHPYTLRLAGVLALVGALLYARLVFAGRFRSALAAAVLIPGALFVELDHLAPIFGWLGAGSQDHVIARIPVERPAQRLVLAAHYDTKTDLLDHVERAPVDLLATPVVGVMILGALAGAAARRFPKRRRWLQSGARAAAAAAVPFGLASFAALSAGAWIPARSPGALDDGAACAVLVRLAAELAAAPPLARTDVEIALFSAEEVGVQGSWVYAERHYAAPPELPTTVINLESIGASAQHALLPSERFVLRSFPVDSDLAALLDGVHRQYLGAPLARAGFGGATDARSFLAHGIPAATLISRAAGGDFARGLHSAADDRSRVDPDALDASLGYLLAVIRVLDARMLGSAK